jgi:nicotinate-nucleotide adenylyltransferase
MEKKIVLFGLNADPPHLGHLKVLHEVEKVLGLDTLFIIMPTGVHPVEKAQNATAPQRLAMAQLLFKGYDRALVDDYEIRKESRAYTLDTLIHLKAKYPHNRLYFIMATDVANHFFSWHESEKILAMASPIIVSRVGYTLDPHVRLELMKKSKPLILETHSLPISSSDIREKIQGSLECKDISHDVKAYIEQHGLYRKKA